MSEGNLSEDPVIVACPKCNAEQEDCDGFGVVFCERCGYCTHSSITGDECDFCGAIDDPQDRCPRRE